MERNYYMPPFSGMKFEEILESRSAFGESLNCRRRLARRWAKCQFWSRENDSIRTSELQTAELAPVFDDNSPLMNERRNYRSWIKNLIRLSELGM